MRSPRALPAIAPRPAVARRAMRMDAIDRNPRVASLRAIDRQINAGPRVAQLHATQTAINAAPQLSTPLPAPRQRLPATAGEVVQAVGNAQFEAAAKASSEHAQPPLSSAALADQSLRRHEEEEQNESMGLGGHASPARDESEQKEQAQNETMGVADQNALTPDEGAEADSEPIGAYIVNAILPFAEVERIPQVLAAMVAGMNDKFLTRVAVVLGINAPAGQEAALQTALVRAQSLVAAAPFPVGLVPIVFKEKSFPYGKVRNQVMRSGETRTLTTYFTQRGLHPYISFQDFDTGSRRVGSESGAHVFEAVERILRGDSSDKGEDDFLDPIRPLMIAGGYRPGASDALVAAIMERLAKSPIEGMTQEKVQAMLPDFEALIAEDMHARDTFARLDPMLPYAPEPNLFVDANAAMTPSPITGKRLGFGPGGAEFVALGKGLSGYAAEELETYHAQSLQGSDVGPEQIEEAQGRLAVDAQTNRHPQRGRTFHTEFENMAVATDLSRLAHGYLGGNSPQSHVGLTQVTDRFFDSKSAKTGAKFAEMSTTFGGFADPKPFIEDLYVRKGGKPSAKSAGYFKRNQSKLGGLKRQKMSGALQQPFSSGGQFGGMSFGTRPDQQVYFAQQLAMHREIARRREAQVMHESVLSEAGRIGVSNTYVIGHADGTDRNCTIISIFAAAGVPLNQQQAQAYRVRLAQQFPQIGLFRDIDLTPPIATAILGLLQAQTGTAHQLNVLQEGPPDQNGDPTHQSVPMAGAGNPILIFFAGTHFSPAWPRQ